jgi:hypothetical protein
MKKKYPQKKKYPRDLLEWTLTDVYVACRDGGEAYKQAKRALKRLQRGISAVGHE